MRSDVRFLSMSSEIYDNFINDGRVFSNRFVEIVANFDNNDNKYIRNYNSDNNLFFSCIYRFGVMGRVNYNDRAVKRVNDIIIMM